MDVSVFEGGPPCPPGADHREILRTVGTVADPTATLAFSLTPDT
jgi:hypothetical protein